MLNFIVNLSDGKIKAVEKMIGRVILTTVFSIVSLSLASADTATYIYDDIGRLVGVNYANGTSITYAYDAAGNRLSEVTSGNFPVEFSIVAVPESATEGSSLFFTVSRVGDLSQAHSVEYATVPATGAAAPAIEGVDYTATNGTLNFASGDVSKTITVSTIDDVALESSETVRVALSNASPGTSIVVAEANGTITDNDVATTLSIANASGNEGSNLVFTVTRSGDLSQAQSINYATSDVTATAGSDYTAVSGTLTFLASETSKSITVATLTDATSLRHANSEQKLAQFLPPCSRKSFRAERAGKERAGLHREGAVSEGRRLRGRSFSFGLSPRFSVRFYTRFSGRLYTRLYTRFSGPVHAVGSLPGRPPARAAGDKLCLWQMHGISKLPAPPNDPWL